MFYATSHNKTSLQSLLYIICDYFFRYNLTILLVVEPSNLQSRLRKKINTIYFDVQIKHLQYAYGQAALQINLGKE